MVKKTFCKLIYSYNYFILAGGKVYWKHSGKFMHFFVVSYLHDRSVGFFLCVFVIVLSQRGIHPNFDEMHSGASVAVGCSFSPS